LKQEQFEDCESAISEQRNGP